MKGFKKMQSGQSLNPSHHGSNNWGVAFGPGFTLQILALAYALRLSRGCGFSAAIPNAFSEPLIFRELLFFHGAQQGFAVLLIE
ncbi:hypothetical protein IDJ77_16095 [Mucilaginibacter sp. ZT4R22]|uniref:Uncharacterized protein n=1 Tax=Mucilaginibacter pankratovii TaxID=2772110 RepID=A0ABR7WSP9_9SPHI|nr:hypothetical protein [Mucilaginibacter pankratovii]MBD1365339.1 hypothetical protein [Mucilaginibacter pankratovii]